MNETMQKIPGIGDIPILGYLFRSKAAQKNRTELVVMITPQILREGSPGVTNALPKLGEPFMSPLDDKKSIAPPPPAFTPGAPTSSNAPAAAPLAVVPATPVLSAATPAVTPAASVASPAPASFAPAMAPASAAVPVVVLPSTAGDPVPPPTAAEPAPAPAEAPVTSAPAEPAATTGPDSEALSKTEAKLRDEQRLREVRQMVEESKQQALAAGR